jgi:hypothetical protein
MAEQKSGNISLNQPLNGGGDCLRGLGELANNVGAYDTEVTKTTTVTSDPDKPPVVTVEHTVTKHRGCVAKMFGTPEASDAPGSTVVIVKDRLGIIMPIIAIGIVGLFAARQRIGNI